MDKPDKSLVSAFIDKVIVEFVLQIIVLLIEPLLNGKLHGTMEELKLGDVLFAQSIAGELGGTALERANDLKDIASAIFVRDGAAPDAFHGRYSRVRYWPGGAAIVNLGVVLSLLGAMLGYVIIAAETPFEAARQGVFPKSFAKTNKNGAPIVAVFVSAAIVQLFLIVSVFSESTHQFFYACAVSTILIPYVCSAAYYMKIAWKKEYMDAAAVGKARLFGTVGFIYTVFLVWVAGLVSVIITTILFASGIIVYAIGQRERQERFLPGAFDKVLAVIIVVLMVVSIALIATGIIEVL